MIIQIHNVTRSQMNRFQVMAKIMAILSEDCRMKPGTQEYKLARKIISSKIDNLGPDVVLEKAKRLKGKFPVNICSYYQ